MTTARDYYYLIRINERTDEIDYFDFGLMDFSIKKGNIATLSSIDCLTTMFEDQDDFEEFIYRDLNTDHDYTYKIQYTNKKGTVKYIPVVWNDYKLNALSKVANGRVDYSIEENYDSLSEIVERIKDVASGTARKIVTNKKEGFKISDDNKSIVEVIASSNKDVPFDAILKSFSIYTEARALYLSSTEKKNFENTFKKMLMNIKF
jgi:hypothetical protein